MEKITISTFMWLVAGYVAVCWVGKWVLDICEEENNEEENK